MINPAKLMASFKFAYQGLYYALKENQNLKIHLIAGILVLILGLLIGLTKYELFGIGFLIVLVISAEMINTSIEEVVDLVIDEHNQHAKVAKDVAAGMVLLTALFAAVVGLFIFIPHILSLFG